MPPLRGVTINSDSFNLSSILSEVGDISFFSSLIPTNVLQGTIQDVENWINTWLDQKLTFFDGVSNQHYFYAKVKVFSLNPLVLNVFACDSPVDVSRYL